MVYLRLLKYPGAKFVVIPDIRNVFNNSHCNLFIDVFGGSGSVSLNINSPITVYLIPFLIAASVILFTSTYSPKDETNLLTKVQPPG